MFAQKRNCNFHKEKQLKEKRNSVTEDDDGNSFEFFISKNVYIMILIDSWSNGGELVHISITNKFKLVPLKL